MTATTEGRLLLKVPEAAAALNISRTTLYELMRAGEIRPVRIGRSVRLPVRELQRWVAAQEAASAA